MIYTGNVENLYNIIAIHTSTFGTKLLTYLLTPLGRPRRRWEDNIKTDLEEVGRSCGDWMELAQDRDR